MSTINNKFRPFNDMDKEFYVSPCTLGNYRDIKRILISYIGTPKENRLAIAQEFNYTKEELENITIIGINEYYEQLAKILFIGADKLSFTNDSILLSEVNKALSFFFVTLNGN